MPPLQHSACTVKRPVLSKSYRIVRGALMLNFINYVFALFKCDPMKMNDSNWTTDDYIKARQFSMHLEKTFQPNKQTEITNRKYGSWLFKSVYGSGKNSLQVKSTIKKLNNRKVSGYDLITGRISKELPRQSVAKLTYLFNVILRLQYVPILWKCTNVIMVLKLRKPTEQATS